MRHPKIRSVASKKLINTHKYPHVQVRFGGVTQLPSDSEHTISVRMNDQEPSTPSSGFSILDTPTSPQVSSDNIPVTATPNIATPPTMDAPTDAGAPDRGETARQPHDKFFMNEGSFNFLVSNRLPYPLILIRENACAG
jgi:hypothetical protein